MSFNPHPPLRADAMPDLSPPHPPAWGVSILTRPYGRMLFVAVPVGWLAPVVSILTRPYGRMLSDLAVQALTWTRGFNPHPPLRADAMPGPRRPRSPAPVSILTRPYGRMLFALGCAHDGGP